MGLVTTYLITIVFDIDADQNARITLSLHPSPRSDRGNSAKWQVRSEPDAFFPLHIHTCTTSSGGLAENRG